MAGLRPGHPRLPYLSAAKTWMPGIADKFTQSAQRQTAMAGHDELRHRDRFHWLLFESDSEVDISDSILKLFQSVCRSSNYRKVPRRDNGSIQGVPNEESTYRPCCSNQSWPCGHRCVRG